MATSTPATTRAPAGPRAGHARAWLMWAVAVSVYLAAVFHRSGLAVASIQAEHRLHVGPSLLATMVAVQLGIYAAMQIPTGAMADRFGPRRMLLVAALLMGGGELLFSVSRSAVPALGGRALIGLGDAVTFLNVLRLAQNWFPVSRYGLLTALTAMVGGIGQLVSTVPLHAGLAHLGWTSTFAATGALTLCIAAPVALLLRDRPPDPGPALARLRHGGAPTEEAVPHPGLRRAVGEVMRVRGTWRGMWVHFALTGPFAVFTALWGYPYLVRAQHYSPATASSGLGLVVVAAVLGGPPTGLIMVRAPHRRAAIVYASAGLLVAAWGLTLGLGPGHDPGWLVVVLLVATGLGGPASAVSFDIARRANRDDRGGAATGVVNIGGFSGAVVADLVIGFLLARLGHGGHSPAGFRWALMVIPVMTATGMAAFWWLSRRDADAAATTGAARSSAALPGG